VSRILQVCNSAFYLSHFLSPLVRGLVAAGHDVECVCECSEAERSLLGSEVFIHSFQYPRSASPASFLAATERMRILLRDKKFDCVVSHNRRASIVGRIAGWLARVPVNVYTAHGFYFNDEQGKLAYEATVALEALLARITDYTLSQSAVDVALMTRRRWIRPSQIEAIGNGIDTQRFAPQPGRRAMLEQSLGLLSRRFRIAGMGRIVRGKGFADLLMPFAALRKEYPEAELVIIGGNTRGEIGPVQAEFLSQARALGVADGLTVTGMVERVEDYLAVSDVFVHPSYREGMPRALLEAMSMALPVIATDIRGCREMVRHGVDGWLYASRDVVQLTRLLREVRADPSRGAMMGGRARARVCESFDERDYVARQVEAIGRLLEDSSDAPRRRHARARLEVAP
jgi:glycosyltransferase involved in cell wall biosynthesis